ncbi:MAG: NAD(P)-dependent oxidoreductase [Clostridia bacterium]|nr:NAD(P)-dependent oxidoreductase [Clostridia bacterium]
MKYSCKKAVVTGATGAVGMALLDELIERGIRTLVLCREASPRSARIPDHPLIRKVNCPLDQMKSWTPDEEDSYDVFFHFAWEGTTGESRNDVILQNRNVTYILAAVDLAQRLGCHTFIGAGSQAEYGRVEGKLSSATPTHPENGYGMAKLHAGQMSRLHCKQRGIRHIWTRILSVYGPYDTERSLVMSTLLKLRAGEIPQCTAGEQIWDYLYSGDAAKAMLAVAKSGRDGGVYCLGGGSPTPLKDYISQIREIAAPEGQVALGAIPYAPGQVMYLCADLSELTRDTGFQPSTPFREGIEKTVAWLDETNQ